MLLNVFGGLFGARCWPSWGALGGYLGALVAFKWHSEFLKLFLWGPWSPQCAPQAALDRPQQRSRRPHREAEGPRKPPRPSFRYRRLSVPDDFGAKSKQKKKTAWGHRQGISEAILGLSSSMFFLSFLLLMFCFCFFFCFSFFSSALSVSFTIIMRLRPRQGLRLELRLRLRMRLGLGL